MSTHREAEWRRSSASINSCVSRARSRIDSSRSSFSIPAWRLLSSPSVDWRTLHSLPRPPADLRLILEVIAGILHRLVDHALAPFAEVRRPGIVPARTAECEAREVEA